jgi:hypothetical protein
MTRLSPTLLAAFALFVCSGCTIIGAGVGSTIPKYEPLPLGDATEPASLGERVRIVRASGGPEVSGSYDGVYDEKLWVRTADGSTSVDVRDVKEVRVVADNHWLEGLFIGLAVDIAAVAIVGSNIRHIFPPDNSSVNVGGDGVSVTGR